VGTIFAFGVAVGGELFPTFRASEFIYRFLFHLFGVRIPPLHPTRSTTEYSFFLTFYRDYIFTAILTFIDVIININRL
jgi:hypothetical protein